MLTDQAIEKMKTVMRQEKLATGTGIRVSVAGGGCSGMSYSMGFETEKRPDDTIYEQNGLEIYVDAASRPYLAGTVVDYVVSLHKEGFKFSNPNASRTCGCGESFGV